MFVVVRFGDEVILWRIEVDFGSVAGDPFGDFLMRVKDWTGLVGLEIEFDLEVVAHGYWSVEGKLRGKCEICMVL